MNSGLVANYRDTLRQRADDRGLHCFSGWRQRSALAHGYFGGGGTGLV
jgi:hypothetical protein